MIFQICHYNSYTFVFITCSRQETDDTRYATASDYVIKIFPFFFTDHRSATSWYLLKLYKTVLLSRRVNEPLEIYIYKAIKLEVTKLAINRANIYHYQRQFFISLKEFSQQCKC